MRITFRGIQEPMPGQKWQALFRHFWPAYEGWFLKEGEDRRPGYLTCRLALQSHMPELVPTFDKLVQLAGGGDRAARLLSLYCPTPYLAGCSQAIWDRDDRPLLVRNYDYHPGLCEGTILHSSWNGVRAIVQSDSLWGALDGMNEYGLAVSLAFGGRRTIGEGFGIPLVLRYILEFCRDTREARKALERIPTHMTYNISAVDATGGAFTAYIAPDRPATFHTHGVSTNHQEDIEWPDHAVATRTMERHDYLSEKLRSPSETRERFIERFLEDPVFSREYRRGFGTLYTAVYDPVRLSVEYRWKHHIWRQSFDDFDQNTLTIQYEAPVQSVPNQRE